MTIDEIIAAAKATYAQGVNPVREQWGDGKTCACLGAAASGEFDTKSAAKALGVTETYLIGLITGWDACTCCTCISAKRPRTKNYVRGLRDGKRARRLIGGCDG